MLLKYIANHITYQEHVPNASQAIISMQTMNALNTSNIT